MFVVILAQSAAPPRAFASRYNERFSENTDLVGLGMANIGAGLFQGFPIGASMSKSAASDGRGFRPTTCRMDILPGTSRCGNRLQSMSRHSVVFDVNTPR